MQFEAAIREMHSGMVMHGLVCRRLVVANVTYVVAHIAVCLELGKVCL